VSLLSGALEHVACELERVDPVVIVFGFPVPDRNRQLFEEHAARYRAQCTVAIRVVEELPENMESEMVRLLLPKRFEFFSKAAAPGQPPAETLKARITPVCPLIEAEIFSVRDSFSAEIQTHRDWIIVAHPSCDFFSQARFFNESQW
jgi:hypothetical protein